MCAIIGIVIAELRKIFSNQYVIQIYKGILLSLLPILFYFFPLLSLFIFIYYQDRSYSKSANTVRFADKRAVLTNAAESIWSMVYYVLFGFIAFELNTVQKVTKANAWSVHRPLAPVVYISRFALAKKYTPERVGCTFLPVQTWKKYTTRSGSESRVCNLIYRFLLSICLHYFLTNHLHERVFFFSSLALD